MTRNESRTNEQDSYYFQYFTEFMNDLSSSCFRESRLDAFEIANQYGIKTINGYSGNFPLGWNEIWELKRARQYEHGVYRWIREKGLKHVYVYDRFANTWTPYETRMSELLNEIFCPEKDKFSISSGLEDWKQGGFAWTSREFETTIRNAKINGKGLVIRMQTCLSKYLRQNPALVPKLSVYIDGDFIQDVEVTDKMTEIVIPVQEHMSDIYTVSLRTNCYFVPKDVGINKDTRRLSIALYYIGD